jgi:hypothetical protein
LRSSLNNSRRVSGRRRVYLEQNAELRIEVAKLAANVAAMRDATPPAADLVN